MSYQRVKSKCGNFTVLEFDTKQELKEYKSERKDLFRFVSYSEAETSEGKFRLVF